MVYVSVSPLLSSFVLALRFLQNNDRAEVDFRLDFGANDERRGDWLPNNCWAVVLPVRWIAFFATRALSKSRQSRSTSRCIQCLVLIVASKLFHMVFGRDSVPVGIILSLDQSWANEGIQEWGILLWSLLQLPFHGNALRYAKLIHKNKPTNREK